MSIQLNTSMYSKSVSFLKSLPDGLLDSEKENSVSSPSNIVEISDEARKLQEMEAEKASLMSMFENSKKTSDAESEGFDNMSKALEIFRRIMHGDHVPPQDEKFLMEFDSDMYMQAKTMQLTNKKPKNYDSIIDENKDTKSINISVDKEVQSETASSCEI